MNLHGKKNGFKPVKEQYRVYWMVGILTIGTGILLLTMLYSVTQGVSNITLWTVFESLFHFDAANTQHLIIRDLRLTRVLASVIVGASLSVAGALMQGMTRNPLADSGLMGLNAGAGFMLAIAFAFLPGLTYTQTIAMAFLGAGLGACAVYGISNLGFGSTSPMKLVLSGAAVTALLVALSQAISLVAKVAQNITFWTMGSVSGTNWKLLKTAIPIALIAIVIAVVMSRYVTILSLGEETAKGLGVNLRLVKIIVMVDVVLLAGTSVAVAGSIGFVGLLIPYLARYFVGVNYRYIVPVSAVMGGILMVLADVGARNITPPFEIPIGAITSLIGVPIFLYIAKKQKGAL